MLVGVCVYVCACEAVYACMHEYTYVYNTAIMASLMVVWFDMDINNWKDALMPL